MPSTATTATVARPHAYATSYTASAHATQPVLTPKRSIPQSVPVPQRNGLDLGKLTSQWVVFEKDEHEEQQANQKRKHKDSEGDRSLSSSSSTSFSDDRFDLEDLVIDDLVEQVAEVLPCATQSVRVERLLVTQRTRELAAHCEPSRSPVVRALAVAPDPLAGHVEVHRFTVKIERGVEVTWYLVVDKNPHLLNPRKAKVSASASCRNGGPVVYVRVDDNSSPIPHGSQKAYVALEEYAEELHAVALCVCFEKKRPDQATLMSAFDAMAFKLLSPRNALFENATGISKTRDKLLYLIADLSPAPF